MHLVLKTIFSLIKDMQAFGQGAQNLQHWKAHHFIHKIIPKPHSV
jgi:hypothetical protein